MLNIWPRGDKCAVNSEFEGSKKVTKLKLLSLEQFGDERDEYILSRILQQQSHLNLQCYNYNVNIFKHQGYAFKF